MSHLNKRAFCGVLATIDKPSDKPPQGAQGRRVILSRVLAEAALPTLVGMGVGFSPSGHPNPRHKVGIITRAELDGEVIAINGYIFIRDFPEMQEYLDRDNLGLSYELENATVEDTKRTFWRFIEGTFTGAAIMQRDKAAYADSWIRWERAGELEGRKG